MKAESSNVVIVMVTTSTQDEAAKIAEQVVKSRLAACASVLPTIHSTYWWEGKLVNDQESLVLIKTVADKYVPLEEAVRNLHSYKVPEIVAIPITQGLPPYLEWVSRETA